jgi:hypothetical protein
VDVQDWRSVSVAPSNYTATDHNTLTGRDTINSHPASALQPSTANFDGMLASTDDTVQKALDTYDDSLRWLLHYIDEGPAERFASGAYKVVSGGVFPTSIIWYDSNGIGKKKIIEYLVTWTGVTPTTVVWKIYDSTETLLKTITDTVTYSGVFEASRIRTIS